RSRPQRLPRRRTRHFDLGKSASSGLRRLDVEKLREIVIIADVAGRNTARGGPTQVVLAGATGRSGLAAARSMSRPGVSFVAVGDEPRGMVARSRHVREYVDAPSAEDDPPALFDAVAAICEQRRARLVIPLIDASLAICSERREALPDRTRLAAPSPAAVRN